MSNQQAVLNLIKSTCGQANVLTIPRLFIDITGDINAALFLSQCIYWSDKVRNVDGWFYKTADEWKAETSLSYDQLKRALKNCKGIVETKIKRANSAPTIHYRVNFDLLTDTIFELLEIRESLNSDNLKKDFQETRISDFQETLKTLTEITTETTIKSTRKKSGKRQENGIDYYPIAKALSDVTGINFEKNKSRLFGEAKHFKPEDVPKILSDYGPGCGWYVNDWRGKKGQAPSLTQVRETWGMVSGNGSGAKQTPVKQAEDGGMFV